MFLGHQYYEELKRIIGPVATVKLAKRYGGTSLYLPKPTLGKRPEPSSQKKQTGKEQEAGK